MPSTLGMSLRTRLIGAFVLVMLLFVAAGGTSLVTFGEAHTATRHAASLNEILVQIDGLEIAVVRQEGGLRGFVLAGGRRYLHTVRTTVAAANDELNALDAHNAWSAQDRARLARLKELEKQWHQDVALPIIAAVQAGDLAQARTALSSGANLSIYDPMRQTLGEFRASLRDQLAINQDEITQRQTVARETLVGMLLFALVVTLLAILIIRRQVTTPLDELTDATERLARGERALAIGYQGQRDEIGTLARAIERFRQNLVSQDRALWVRDQRARIVAMMHDYEHEKALAEAVLAELAPVLGAGAAALFMPLWDDDQIDNQADDQVDDLGSDAPPAFGLLAGYGQTRDSDRRIAPGDGLVGQVIADGRTIVLDEVPADYCPITSGTGGAAPRHLVIAPALVGGRVEAVVEMAFFARPSGEAAELFESLLSSVALALIALARGRRTLALLEESRARTEALRESEAALRRQQAEIQEANVELRAQSEELNAQAEELRTSEQALQQHSDALQASNQELRDKQDVMVAQQDELSRMTAEARERADALAKANQYKSEFLANMSHELRTPLNSLLILSRSLADNDEGHLDAEQVEAATIIHESGTNLLTLINDILDLSKIEAGKMQVAPATVELAAIARRIERNFAHVAERKGLRLVVSIADDAPATLYTDSGKLEQIVRNLVANAIKFTERGSVRVEIARPGPDVVLRRDDATRDNLLAVHVSDDGIGIPEARLEQIFQAFEQVDASTSRNYGGTGLGLSISRELARLLGGEIHVESRLGEGSRFTAYIAVALPGNDLAEAASVHATGDDESRPLAMPENSGSSAALGEAGTREPVPAAAPARARPLLLVIDDDRAFAQIVATAARKRGFECQIAFDGERGLASARQWSPDAIVLDLGLPGMDGWAVLDRLKASDLTRSIPVHIISAADDPGQVQRAGALGYMQKPISREDLELFFNRAQALTGRAAQRVLVIDDDRDAQAVIRRLLAQESIQIETRHTGLAGLAALDDARFDCVVLDLHLPDIDGFALLERIAARPASPPVVVYSARDLTDDELARLRAHTDSIVIKGSHAPDRLLDEISLFFRRLAENGDLATPPAPAPAASAPSPELNGTTVLLVDDDMRNTFALSRVLRARGMKVLMAADGFKALDQLAAHPEIDVVLMDVMMPGMDGYETTRRIRAQPDQADLPILALTAKAMSGDREKCLAAGANDYLTKPLDTDQLVERMAALL